MGITFKTETKVRVRVNGNEFTNIGDAPPEAREALEKALAQRAAGGTINLNGKTYASLDELPPEDREKYETALRLAGDRLGAIGAPTAPAKFAFRIAGGREPDALGDLAPTTPRSYATVFFVALAIVAAAALVYLAS